MGVPKFFRWLSERYPKIVQRYGSLPDPETTHKHFPERGDAPKPFEEPDPMATCGLAPPIDRLYLDMNGIIHGCSHNNDDDEDNNNNGYDTGSDNDVEGGGSSSSSSRRGVTNEQIFRNVCYYLDRTICDMVQPEKLVYMAIDGVAPRAKMNQQRSRRYRSGGDGEIETTVYGAHLAANEEKERLRQLEKDGEENDDEESESSRDKEGRLRHGVQDGSYSFVLDFEEGNKIPSSSNREYNNIDDETNKQIIDTIRNNNESKAKKAERKSIKTRLFVIP